MTLGPEALPREQALDLLEGRKRGHEHHLEALRAIQALAGAWYPFPRWLRETASFKHVYGIESLVWGGYFVARSALRLAMLLHGSLESFLLVTFVTGTPGTILLLVWSIRFSMRRLADVELPEIRDKTSTALAPVRS